MKREEHQKGDEKRVGAPTSSGMRWQRSLTFPPPASLKKKQTESDTCVDENSQNKIEFKYLQCLNVSSPDDAGKEGKKIVPILSRCCTAHRAQMTAAHSSVPLWFPE